MQTSIQRIFTGIALLTLTCVGSVMVYYFSGWDLLDSVYMVVITIFGVGYGEVRPLTDPRLKIFTMLLVVAGCSSGAYVIGGFIQLLAEGEMNRFLGARRMSKGISGLNGHAIICGYGRVGQILALELHQLNQLFLVVDTNAERLREAEAQGYYVLIGDAAEEKVLKDAGVERARVLASVLPNDTINVFITLTARDLNPKLEIIARGESPTTERKLLRAGANKVVLPAAIGASKIAHLITRPSAESLLREATGSTHLNDELTAIGLQLSEVAIDSGSPIAGKTLRSVELSGAGGVVIVAIKKSTGEIVHRPDGQTLLAAGDVIVLIGHIDDIPQLAINARASSKLTYRGGVRSASS